MSEANAKQMVALVGQSPRRHQGYIGTHTSREY